MKTFDIVMNCNIEKKDDAYNAYELTMKIIAKCSDGSEFPITLRQKGRTETEVVSDLQRQEIFWNGIKSLSLAALKTDYEDISTEKEKEEEVISNKRELFYNDLRKNMETGKYGEIRKFLHDNGFNIKVKNGADKIKLADDIVKAVKQREQETENAKNN